MRNKPGVGRAEGDVLRFIAESGTASVTEVGDYLAATKGLTRNTALTMMERLRTKGFLTRKKVEGLYRYAPVTAKETLMSGIVEDFVGGVLGGSISPLVAYLGRQTEVSSDQLEELRRLVKSLDESNEEQPKDGN